jgi:hypothetical protein
MPVILAKTILLTNLFCSDCSSSIEINHQTKDIVKKSQIGAGAAIKIDHAVYQSAKSYGRQYVTYSAVAVLSS